MSLRGKKGLIVGIANEHSIAFEDVGHLAAFLVGDGAGALTGNIAYIDAGYHIVG